MPSDKQIMLLSDEVALKIELLFRDIERAVSLYRNAELQLSDINIRRMGFSMDTVRTSLVTYSVQGTHIGDSAAPLEPTIYNALHHRIETLREMKFESTAASMMNALVGARMAYQKAAEGWSLKNASLGTVAFIGKVPELA